MAKRKIGLEGLAEAERRIEAWMRDPSRVLNLRGLGLTELPEAVRELAGVKLLYMGGNAISVLPPWIAEMRRLRLLDMAGNRLRELPDEIGNLRKLNGLWLQGNDLQNLPAVLTALPLTDLMLSGNPALGLPDSILDQPPEAILRYYFESRAAADPLQEVKVLLVGRGKAGKTTLVKQLAGEAPDANESETHSIAIREFPIECGKGTVRARAWDFGGQEILHSTHQFFLTERSLYLVVLEPRTGSAQRDAEYWLHLIESQGGGSPAIVVLNWSRGRRWDVDRVKLRRKFPFIVDFVVTDALHSEGVSELRTMIAATVEDHMKDVWVPFPKRWREIKDAVATMQENFLTFSEYSSLCSRLGETDAKAQTDLAGILHALGLALYFGNDPRLADTRVLNPSWVTGGVYAVIRSPEVARKGGQLSVTDMKGILAGQAAYPPKTHQFILDLMRAFQLCYASGDDAGGPVRYLVPELLPEFEPEMSQDWEHAPVRLRYRYQVLPPGLLPRFIVRTHGLSEDAPLWRHGVVLRHAGAEALVRAESDRQELHVFVLGGDEEVRRVLVSMVRRELAALHAEIRISPVEELEITGEGEQWVSVRALRELEEPDTRTQKIAVQPEGTAEVDVARELNKLLPEEARGTEPDAHPVRVFVSYAHDDERQLKRLDLMLDVLEQQQGLATWRDQRLIAGEAWDREIRQRLEEMDVFLFIASATSLVRPYIRDPELRRARERHEAGEVEIVSVKLEPCAVDEDAFLGKLQRLAPRCKSVAETSPKSKAWEQVRKDLLPVIARVRESKKSRHGVPLSD